MSSIYSISLIVGSILVFNKDKKPFQLSNLIELFDWFDSLPIPLHTFISGTQKLWNYCIATTIKFNKQRCQKSCHHSANLLYGFFFTFLLFLTYALARDFLELCMCAILPKTIATQVNSDVKNMPS